MSFLGGILGGINAAVSSPLGGLLGDVASNAWSAKEAARNRDFQSKMSNTAHQREVSDLRAAGLNPILSAGGKGASTPGGASGTISSLSSGIGRGANSAVANATALHARTEGQLAKDKLKFYQAMPEALRAGYHWARMSRDAGLPPMLGGAGVFANSAKSLKQWFNKHGFTKGPTPLSVDPNYPRHEQIPIEPNENKEFWDEFWRQSKARGYKMQRN